MPASRGLLDCAWSQKVGMGVACHLHSVEGGGGEGDVADLADGAVEVEQAQVLTLKLHTAVADVDLPCH